jgi:hypothetical protein
MNKRPTVLGLAACLAVACGGADRPLDTDPGAGASTCRLAPPCPSGWYQYSDTLCPSPGIGSGPGCRPNGDGLCYQPCKSSTDCNDPTFPNCTALWIFNYSDSGLPKYVCTSDTPVPACTSDVGGSSGSTGGAPVGGGGAGGAPSSGGSGPASAELLAATPDPWGLAVDATTIYVAARLMGPLITVPIAGGAITQLAPATVFTVAIDETSVYWSDGTSLYSCAKHGCTASTIALAESGMAFAIAVDATNVYWANNISMKLMKVAKQGGVSVALASYSYPSQIAVDDTNVYWTDQLGTVMKVPAAGGAAVKLATCLIPMGIAVDGTNVYYTTSDGQMMQVPKDGGAALTLSAELGNDPWGIATDGKNVYGTSREHGTIIKVPVGGGAATVLASGQGDPTGIAVDATHVYWTVPGTGKVMKIAK